MKCIDLFAGLGGFSKGAELAGAHVIWAANHWGEAVKFHQLNNPGTKHVCQDLHQADFSIVPRHDVMLASPCCQGHSRAKGKNKPHHDASRSTAWAVVTAAEACKPAVLVVENVREFQDWRLYPIWVSALERLGYTLQPHILDAAKYGVPQNRVRLFLVGVKSRTPLRLNLQETSPVPARSFIDLQGGRWRKIKIPRRSSRTLKAIENGRKQLGTDVFLRPYYSSGSGLTGRSLDRPIGTITTVDRWSIIRGDEMRMISAREALAAMSFPDTTLIPSNHKDAMEMIGNAVPPTMAAKIISAIRKQF